MAINPSFLVSKKIVDTKGNEVKSGHRLVVDHRTLNANTQVPISPFPDLRAVLDSLHGCNYFSLLDLSQWLPADFSGWTHTGLVGIHDTNWNLRMVGHALCSIRMPNNLSYRNILHPVRHSLYVSIWGNGIVIGGSTIDSCVQRTVSIFERLQANLWYVNTKTCKFAQTSLKALVSFFNKEVSHQIQRK